MKREIKGLKAALYTLGCKVNQFESACLAEGLQVRGWEAVPFKEKADLYIVNTCAVTAEAQRQSAQMVRKAVRDHPGSLVVVTGCAAQIFTAEFQKIPGLDYLIGNCGKLQIPEMACSLKKQKEPFLMQVVEAEQPVQALFPLPGEKTRAFLRLQDGCNAHCSYCLVPRARGRSRSLPPDSVLAGVSSFARRGIKELILTGIHLGQYGQDLCPAVDLTGLLETVLPGHPDLHFRLSSLEPQEVSPPLLDLFQKYPNLCPHLHIPLQSGDDGILKKMNRTYSAEAYGRLIETIHRQIPWAAIGADLIIGFPGEGEAQFQNSLKLIRDIPLSYLHIFPFSPRPGTPAMAFPGQVPEKIKKDRLLIVRSLDADKRQVFSRHCLGGVFSALTLQPAEEKGRTRVLTENYLTVSLPGRLKKNERLRVKLTSLEPGGLKGERVFG